MAVPAWAASSASFIVEQEVVCAGGGAGQSSLFTEPVSIVGLPVESAGCKSSTFRETSGPLPAAAPRNAAGEWSWYE